MLAFDFVGRPAGVGLVPALQSYVDTFPSAAPPIQQFTAEKRAFLDGFMKQTDLVCYLAQCAADGTALVNFPEVSAASAYNTFSYTLIPHSTGNIAFDLLSRRNVSWVLVNVADVGDAMNLSGNVPGGVRVIVTLNPAAVAQLASPGGDWAIYDPLLSTGAPAPTTAAAGGGGGVGIAIAAALIAIGGLLFLSGGASGGART